MTAYSPAVPLARLYEKRSLEGTQYFAGRLGLSNIVLLPSNEVTETGDRIWILSISEPPAKPETIVTAPRARNFVQVRGTAGPALANDPLHDLWGDR